MTSFRNPGRALKWTCEVPSKSGYRRNRNWRALGGRPRPDSVMTSLSVGFSGEWFLPEEAIETEQISVRRNASGLALVL
jgi:hypothetical protein